MSSSEHGVCFYSMAKEVEKEENRTEKIYVYKKEMTKENISQKKIF